MSMQSEQSAGLSRLVGRAMTEIGDDAVGQDALISLYAAKAADRINGIRHYLATDDAPVEPRYENTLIDMVVFSFNKRGAEGQSSHSENGVGRNYEGGSYPASLLAGIAPKVNTLRSEE